MLGKHDRAILQFSGGKDSTALLYLARPWLSQITVAFTDPGATFPHVKEFIVETCSRLGATLEFVRPPMNVLDYTEQTGYPVDLLPVESLQVLSGFVPQARSLQPYTDCCASMLWRPMLEYTLKSGASLVLRGAKECDARRGVKHAMYEGIEYASPLWDWSNDQVYAYLKEQRVKLPRHYPEVEDSLDCWVCTAHMPHNGKEKAAFMKREYPELWAVTSERIRRVEKIVRHNLAQMEPVLELAKA